MECVVANMGGVAPHLSTAANARASVMVPHLPLVVEVEIKIFNGFATTGNTDQRKQEVAAFLAQTSHETTERNNPGTFCSSPDWPCASGKQYYGRGPIQITHNYNYGQAGKAIGADLINNPDLVATDATISFKTAIWFWMTPQSSKPSSHNVIIGRWSPSAADNAANRVPGYGVITNIINGGLECNRGTDSRVQDRIGFYKKYCDILGVGYGHNLDCNNQSLFLDLSCSKFQVARSTSRDVRGCPNTVTLMT
ncbi:hypothetical protein AgCh_039528 [Apium graveolens]